MSRWIATYACDAVRCVVPTGREATPGVPMAIGREGEVPVGADPEDPGVSRRAAVLTATAAGWDLQVSNRNGIVVHPWGQPPSPARRHEVLTWPRIGLRVRGADDAVQHWVLLETTSVTLPPTGPVRPDGPGTRTARSRSDDPLTTAQITALRTVFAEHLRWPPVASAVPLQLKQAASRLQLSEAGVKDRLGNCRRRAEQLGLHHGGATTDPSYLFFLVRAGLLAPPPRLPHRRTPLPAGVEPAPRQSGPSALDPV